MENLSITTIPVTIRVMEVGGKKLTLSVFKQIPEDYYFFDENISSEQREKEYLGWVFHSDKRFILYSRGGILLKDPFEEKSLSSQRYDLEREKADLKSHGWNYDEFRKEKIRERIKDLEQRYSMAIKERDAHNEMWEAFLQNKYQIYIAI